MGLGLLSALIAPATGISSFSLEKSELRRNLIKLGFQNWLKGFKFKCLNRAFS